MNKVRLLPLLLLALACIAAVTGLQQIPSFAAVNMDCKLRVPADPLTAQGLATPYVLSRCKENNTNQAVFVQGAVFDPATSKISIYNPLVITKGTKPAVDPTVPNLPDGSIVAVWGGGNDNVTKLVGPGANQCVNGSDGSPFGQFWYCGAEQFFAAVRGAIAAGRLTVPALGTANDGMTCPTVRDFSIVDQDQSDNVTTQYLITRNGRSAQDTAANRAQLGNATLLVNPSDNLVLSEFVDPAIGCTPWMAPDLADNGAMKPALPLDEIQAAVNQQAPIALVPLGDPMTQVHGEASLQKVNLYRTGVNQPPANTQSDASTTTYCTNISEAPTRLAKDSTMTLNFASPAPAVGNNLFTFLSARYVAAYQILNCQNLIGKPDRIKLITNGQGVTIAAVIDGKQIP